MKLKRSFYSSYGLFNKDYYTILGVPRNADKTVLKKSYHKLAMQFHPDRNKEPDAAEKFKEISEAYSVLSDDQKRNIYDQYGEEGVKNASQGNPFGNMSAEDFFSQIFGMGGMGNFGGFGDFGGNPFGGNKKSRESKTEDLQYNLKITMEEVYNRVTKKIEFMKNVACKPCNGSGSTKPNANHNCATCKGHGVVVKTIQLGPGMIQQMRQNCAPCNGTGRVINPADRCATCSGKGTSREPSILEVKLDASVVNNNDVIFRRASHDAPGAIPGDIHVNMEMKPHAYFQLRGYDLTLKKDITLVEAISGFEFQVKHLDGRTIKVKNDPSGTIVKPGDVQIIRNEGMPTGNSKGDLYIVFDVKFPKSKFVPVENLQKLESIQTKVVDSAKANKEVILEETNVKEEEVNNYSKYSKKKSGSKKAEQGAQCAQM
jgi:DnaJ family protein A protein 2